MATVDPLVDPVPPDLENDFWTQLRTALIVLNADTALAQIYRQNIHGSPVREKFLAFHDDPLDVAAFLAGISFTEDHLAQYNAALHKLASRKIRHMLVGEAMVGEGNEVAHIDLIMGPRGSAAETAFVSCLTTTCKDGFLSTLAVLTPNMMAKPATAIFNKVTIKYPKQWVQFTSPARFAVARALADSVAVGTIPREEADDVFLCVGIFIHWDAVSERKIYRFNYEAMRLAIEHAIDGVPAALDPKLGAPFNLPSPGWRWAA